MSVLVWNYHDDDLPAGDAPVELNLRGLPVPDSSVLVEHRRIDGDHSNAFAVWKRMGSPQQPEPEQLAALKRSAQLEAMGSPRWHRLQAGAISLRFALPRQAVSLITLRW